MLRATLRSFLGDLFTLKEGTPMLRICGSGSEKEKAFLRKEK